MAVIVVFILSLIYFKTPLGKKIRDSTFPQPVETIDNKETNTEKTEIDVISPYEKIDAEIIPEEIVRSIKAGEGIAVTAGQFPTVSNTGVLSLGGKTGVVYVDESGLKFDGQKLYNADRGSSQNIFKEIKVDGEVDIKADTNHTNLYFAAGTGMEIDTNNDQKRITFNSKAGWIDHGNVVSLVNEADNLRLNGVTYTFPNTQGGSGTFLQNDGSGGLTWASFIASMIPADTLDFTELKDNLTLDASTNVALAGNNFTFSGMGNVGIGTSSPAAPFEVAVNGSGFSSIMGLGSGAVNLGFGWVDNTTYHRIRSAGVGNDNILLELVNPLTHYFGISGNFQALQGATVGYSAGITPPSSGLAVSGNVGIGTTSPGAALEIWGSGGEKLRLRNDSSNNNYLSFYNSGTSKGYLQYANNETYLVNSAAGGMHFFTNDTEKLTILSGGNVGIGTTSPTEMFSVGTSSQFRVNPTGQATANGLRLTGGETLNTIHNLNGTGISITDASYVSLGRVSQHDLYLSGSSGNVGIGTTAPAQKLSVDGNIQWGNTNYPGFNGYLTTGSTNSALYPAITRNLVGSTGNSYTIANGELDTYSGIQYGHGNIAFFSATGSFNTGDVVTPVSRMLIDSTGNVGIGTTGPANLLHLVQSSSGTETIPLLLNNRFDVSGTATALGFAAYNGNTVTGKVSNIQHASGYDMALSTYNQSGGLSEKMRIKHDGNVGIGTTAPSAALDVNGVIEIGDGSTSTPGLSFGSDTDTGLYRVATNAIGLVTGGSNRWTLDSNGMFIGAGTSQILNTLGSVGDPSYSFSGDENTGVFSPGADIVGLQTGGSERVRIDSSGNVGIGTTAPSTKLHVVGDARITGALYDSSNSAGSSGMLLTSTGTGTSWSTVASTLDSSYFKQGGNSFSGLATLGTNDSYGLALETGGSERLRIDANGKIGIGTSTPSYALDIQRASTGTADFTQGVVLKLEDTNNTNRNVSLAIGTGGGNWVLHPNIGSGAKFNISFGTSELFTIDRTTGYVGIGTTDPTVKLQVGSISDTDVNIGRFAANSATTNGVGISFLKSGGTDRYMALGGSGLLHIGANPSSYSDADLASAAQVTITNTGNVGIGTTAPSAKLQVDGNVRVKGATYGYEIDRGDGAFANIRGGLSIGNSGVDYGISAAGGEDFGIYGSNYGNNWLTIKGGTGNVGIGTTAPSQALHVVGSARITGALYDSSNSAGSSGMLLTSTGTGTTWSTVSGTLDSSYFKQGGNSFSGLATLGTNDSYGLALETGGTERLRINSSGNVSIGTSQTLGDALTIEGSGPTAAYINIFTTGGGSVASPALSGLKFGSSDSNYFVSSIESMSQSANYVHGVMKFNVASNITTGTIEERMRIDGASGYVGIGTTNPGEKLHIEGGRAKVVSSGEKYSLGFSRNEASSNTYWWGVDAGGGSGNAQFSNAGGTALMTITDGGNVGIGTTAPVAKLDVRGTIYSNSGLYLSDSNIPLCNSGPCYGIGLSSLDLGGGAGSTVQVAGYYGLNFSTSNNNRFSITSSGNVGIGTTAPGGLLHLYSANDGTVTNIIEHSGGKWGSDSPFARYKYSTSATTDLYTAAGNQFVLDHSGSDLWLFTDSGRNLSLQKDGGNVGIGTTAPNQKLEVAGNLIVNNGYPSAIYLGGTSSSFNVLEATNNQVLHINKSVWPNVSISGNVGVGIADPAFQLEVGKNTGGVISISTAGQAGLTAAPLSPALKFLGYADSVKGEISVQDQSGNLLGGWMKFQTADSSDVLQDRMMIDRAGNVGIGTTAPGQLLQVSGASGSAIGIKTPWAGGAYGQLRFETGTGESSIRSYVPGDSTNGLQFYTYGSGSETAKLTILGSGNIGIGTTGPTAKLEVNGDIRIPTGSKIYFESSGTSNSLYRVSADGSTALTSPADFIFGSGSLASTFMTIKNTGNVGIGTTAPNYKLEVNGATGSLGIVNNQNQNLLPSIYFADTNFPTSYLNKISSSISGAADGNGKMIFSLSTGASSYADVLTLLNTGNVGIGTTAPGAKLEIFDTTGENFYITRYSDNLNGANIKFQKSRGTISSPTVLQNADQVSYLQSWGYVRNAPNTANAFINLTNIVGSVDGLDAQGRAGGALGFYTSSGVSAASTEKMRITSSGNVGIGTTSPSAKMQIVGTGGGSIYDTLGVFSGQNSDGAGTQISMGIPGAESTPWSKIRSYTSGSSRAYDIIVRDENTSSDTGFGAFYRQVYKVDVPTALTPRHYFNGNVGIGTSNPSQKFELANGTMRLTNDYGIEWGGTNNQIYGSEASDYLRFRTNGSERLAIDSSGNVGIGTTAPTEKLDITGNSIRINALSAQSSSVLFAENGSAKWTIGNTTSSDRLSFYKYTGGNAEALSILNTGNVGIGTTAPGVKLDVSGGDIRIANNQSLRFLTSASSSRPIINVNANNDLSVGTASGSDMRNLYFSTGTGFYSFTTGSSETMRLTSSGNLGIGTTAPGYKLTVAGDIGTTGDYYTSQSGSAFAQTLNSSNGYFRFMTTVGGVLTEKVRIANDGNVGIGTTAPGALLDLSASATTTNVLNLTANSLTTGKGFNLTSTSTGLTTGNLMNMYWNPGSSTTATGDLFKIDIGANALVTGNIFALYNNGSALFTVGTSKITSALPHEFTAAGDVSFASDISLTDQTSNNISSLGPLTITSGESYENLDLTLKAYGVGGIIIDQSALSLNTGENLILDSDDTSDSYFEHNNASNYLSVFTDGTEVARFMSDGSVDANTTFDANQFDIAEYYPTTDSAVEAGDVVVLSKSDKKIEELSAYLVNKVDSKTTDKVLGVVSTKPGFSMGGGSFRSQFCAKVTDGNNGEESAREELIKSHLHDVARDILLSEIKDGNNTEATVSAGLKTIDEDILQNKVNELYERYKNGETELLDEAQRSTIEDKIATCKSIKQVPIALAGRVPVKVDLTAGEIKTGDLLTASPYETGKAMKATSAGWVLGRALEDAKNGDNTVMVYVFISWYDPAQNGSVAGISTSQPLDLSASVLDGDLTATGKILANEMGVTDHFTAGLLQLNASENSINVVAAPLLLQNAAGAGEIQAFGGKLVMTVTGGIVSQDMIKAKTIVAEQYAVLGASENASIGEGKIEVGKTEVLINNSRMKASSKVFVTATSTTGGKELIVKEKKDGSFTVVIESGTATDITFDYWIVDVVK